MSIADSSILPLTVVSEVCFTPGVDEISVTGGPTIEKSPSSSEFLPDEEEAASTCPLLTPSPPVGPTGEDGLFSGMVYDGPLKSDPLDLEMTLISSALNGTPASGYIGPAATADGEGEIGPINESSLQIVDDDQPVYINGTESVKSVHSSSSSSSAQEPNACVQLLNSHHYQHLNKANDIATFNCQENGVKPTFGIPLTLPKSSDDMCFINWNWPVIRKTCFWGALSMLVGFFCIIVAMIVTMPRDCKPQNEWWQGTVVYEVFPASFRDSGHGGGGAGWGNSRESKDGVGDLRGLTSRVSYLKLIGVRVLYLNAVLQTSGHYPEDHDQIASLKTIEPALGGETDFKVLVRTLHKENISVLLDLPIHPYLSELSELEANVTSVDGEELPIMSFHGQKTVTDAFIYWLSLGVDGFYLRGLDGLTEDPAVLPSLLKWRSLINNFEPTEEEKQDHLIESNKYRILICDEEAAISLVPQVERIGMYLEDVFDLVHVSLNMTDPEKMVNKVQKVLGLGGAFLSQPPKTILHIRDGLEKEETHQPWVMWSVRGSGSNPGGHRIASQLPSHNGSLGAIILQMMLPGSPCILYGDEIGLEDLHDSEEERKELPLHVRHLGPMPWPHLSRIPEFTASPGFTSPGVLPWLPMATASAADLGPILLSTMSRLRSTSPSIYMSGVWKNGRYLPGFTIRHKDESIVALERSYPRLATYAVLANLGHQKEIRDLSGIFYSGEVVAGALMAGKTYPTGQRISFHSLMLSPGEAVVVKLDK